MKILKIVVGTTSEQKIDYLKEILDEIGIKADIISADVKSEVSNQPITEEETQTGSLNRARSAFEKNINADFGIGIEVGYHKYSNDKYEMFCCSTIFAANEFILTC